LAKKVIDRKTGERNIGGLPVSLAVMFSLMEGIRSQGVNKRFGDCCWEGVYSVEN